jgi:hypothetical protein
LLVQEHISCYNSMVYFPNSPTFVMSPDYDSHLDTSRGRWFFLVPGQEERKLAWNNEQGFCHSGSSRFYLVPMYLFIVSMNHQCCIESVTWEARPALWDEENRRGSNVAKFLWWLFGNWIEAMPSEIPQWYVPFQFLNMQRPVAQAKLRKYVKQTPIFFWWSRIWDVWDWNCWFHFIVWVEESHQEPSP